MSTNYNSKIETDGLVLAVDATNIKSYSSNVHPKPTDIYGWIDAPTGNYCNLSRDTIPSPVGSTPLKMVQSGNDPYIRSETGATWKLAPAVAGETWTVSVWVKASEATTVEGCWISEQNSIGNYIGGSGGNTPNVGTTWTRISKTYTLINALTAFVGLRLDGTQTGGSGITVWWDGLQLEKTSSVKSFNPNTYSGYWKDLATASNLTIHISAPLFDGASLTFNGTSDYIDGNGTPYPANTGDNFSVEVWLKIPASATWGNGNHGGIITRGQYFGSIGLIRDHTLDNRIGLWVRGLTSGFGYSFGTITRDTWNHCVGTWDGSVSRLYINGIAQTPSTITISGGFSPINWLIGGNPAFSSTNGNWFNGSISNAKVYSKALSFDQVNQNFNANRGRYGL